MSNRRGVIITKDGQRHEVPEALLDQDVISWPPTLSEKKPYEPVTYLKSDDLYRRHEVVPGEAYVFTAESVSLQDVPADVIESLQSPKQPPEAGSSAP